MTALFWVGLGGCIGSCARYLLSNLISASTSSSFPWATFTINVVGSFVIGIVYALSARSVLSFELRLFLATGICGGFTTFSTFSAETLILVRDGALFPAFLYVAGSVLAGLAATFVAMWILRSL